jgi:zinc/manganese transport system substrate-binding protein
MNRKVIAGIIVVALIIIAAAVGYFLIKRESLGDSGSSSLNGKIRIVAAENFYGNIAGQLGGDRVSVTSILSDPNVDPHEYESSVQDGIAITNANIVIENGLQYDIWIDKLLLASPNPDRIVIVAGNVATNPLPDNPHVWYGIDNAGAIAQAITDALIKTDPTDSADFESNLAEFNDSLAPLQAKMDEIKARYAGTPVALTETIYLYETQPMGLDVLTPFDFEKAIAEGNDPSAESVDATDRQIDGDQVKVLIYNSQTVTPVTTNLLAAAEKNNIPVVPVSETMPPNVTYQAWILDELNNLEQSLARATGH